MSRVDSDTEYKPSKGTKSTPNDPYPIRTKTEVRDCVNDADSTIFSDRPSAQLSDSTHPSIIIEDDTS